MCTDVSLIRYPGCKILTFFNDTATTEIYTLSLHDALPILAPPLRDRLRQAEPSGLDAEADRDVPEARPRGLPDLPCRALQDWKSTRLNFSHANLSHAVFCLKKKTLLYLPLLVTQPLRQPPL